MLNMHSRKIAVSLHIEKEPNNRNELVEVMQAGNVGKLGKDCRPEEKQAYSRDKDLIIIGFDDQFECGAKEEEIKHVSLFLTWELDNLFINCF